MAKNKKKDKIEDAESVDTKKVEGSNNLDISFIEPENKVSSSESTESTQIKAEETTQSTGNEDISPKMIEHFVKNFFGTMDLIVSKKLDVEPGLWSLNKPELELLSESWSKVISKYSPLWFKDYPVEIMCAITTISIVSSKSINTMNSLNIKKQQKQLEEAEEKSKETEPEGEVNAGN